MISIKKVGVNVSGKNRIIELDIAKGIVIIFVVMFHIVCFYEKGIMIMQILLGYAMPFFFITAGYFYKSGRKTSTQNIKNRIEQMLKPYFGYSLFFALLYLLTEKAPLSEVVRSLLSGFLTRPLLNIIAPGYFDRGTLGFLLAPYWFLFQMAISSVIFFLIADKALLNRRNMIISLSVLLLTGFFMLHFLPLLPWTLQCTPVYVFFMLFGAYAGKSRFVDHLQEMEKAKKCIIGIGMFCAAAVIAYFFPGATYVERGFFGEYGGFSMLFVVVQSICGSVALILFCQAIKRIPLLTDILLFYGENSMSVLMVHTFLGYYLCKITGMYNAYIDYLHEAAPSNGVLQSWIEFFIVLILCAVYIFVEKYVKGKMQK